MGELGALVIIDVWIKWLIGKPKNKYLYWLGVDLYRIPYFNIIVHRIASILFRKTERKKHWAFREMKTILENSMYLILALEENIDFSYDDIDESKKKFEGLGKYFGHIYAHDSDFENPKMEYWNMHTFSNKTIEISKIALLKTNESYSANDILICMINNNIKYVEDNCPFLKEYLKFINEKK